MIKKREIDRRVAYFIAFVVFLLSAIYITYPLIFHLGTFSVGLGDELVITYIQNWVIHSLFLNLTQIFNASIYFPYKNTLAFSDIFITSSLLGLTLAKILNEPMVGFNFTLISSLFLVGFSLFCLSFYISKDFIASLFSGILVVFSPAVLVRAGHLQILSLEWVIFSVLFFIIYLNTFKYKYLFIGCVFFLLQVYNSFLPGYFIIFWSLFIIAFFLIYKKGKLKDIFSKKVIASLFFTLLAVIPIIIPYYQVSNQFHYVRDIRETIHFALQPEDLFYPSTFTRLHNLLLFFASFEKAPANAELKPGYLGLIFTILFIMSLIYCLKRFRNKDYILNSFFITAIFGLALSFGPVLHLSRYTIHKPFPIVLPYAVFYYVIPGFQGIRNSSRWEMLFIIASSVVIAIFLARSLKKITGIKRILLYLILFLAVIVEYKFPMKFYAIDPKENFPKVYSWIARQTSSKVFIEMPIFNWDMWPYTEYELKREYYDTVSFPKTVNGYSGFSPHAWQELVRYELLNFPSKDSILKLKNLGVDYVLVDKDIYNKLHHNGLLINKELIPDGDSIFFQLSKSQNLIFVRKIGTISVYKISVKKNE